MLAIAFGVIVGLAAGLFATALRALFATALRAPACAYLTGILALGIAAMLVVARRSVTRSAGRAASAILVAALLLIVAAPRPLTASPTEEGDPPQLKRPDGTALTYDLLDDTRTPNATPVIFVHGGPGVSTRGQDRRWLEELALTRPVLAYDQIGAGNSSRLADPASYTLDRSRDDLEALREHMGFDRVILIGHSWGAVVAASYVAENPERVEALLALSPGSLHHGAEIAANPAVRLTGRDRFRLLSRLLRPRELYTYGMSQVDLATTHTVIGDAEMDRRYNAILAATWPAMFCDPALSEGLEQPSGGFFAHQAVSSTDTAPASDVLPLTAPPPTLVIKPECDYLAWSTVDGFVDRLNAQVAYVPGAGHAVHLEQRQQVKQLVEAFLAGRHAGEILNDPARAPSSYQGPP